MTDSIPLCFLRIWCRKNGAWLSFKTITQDRYLVNPQGYFIELPEGSLTQISPRTTFPVVNRFPSVVISSLAVRKQFGEGARFITVPVNVSKRQDPQVVPITQLKADCLGDMTFAQPLSGPETYLLLRAVENGLVAWDDLPRIAKARGTGRSIGEVIIQSGTCQWESLLSFCLDIRPPSRLDPPSLRTMIERREWELTGEILIAMDRINRTELEHALKIKRDGSQALGQILTAMGTCNPEDIDRCLKIQNHLKLADREGIVLIGNLLVAQGVITADDLEEVLRKQRVARQPLGRILVSMGACAQREIEEYEANNSGRFQTEIDEIAMGEFLVKTDTISSRELQEAQRIQMRGRQVLGEMLVAMGMASADEVDEVVNLQREIREHYRSGVKRLGDLLMAQNKVPAAKVDEAVQLQSIGRQPFGAILVALGACTTQDVMEALEIQQKWRSKARATGDRLGEALVKSGIISESALQGPLQRHMEEEKPLGRILIESKLCAPEQIIDTLIERDYHRQEEFCEYVRRQAAKRPSQPQAPESQVSGARPAYRDDIKPSIVGKLSSWISRAKEKDQP